MNNIEIIIALAFDVANMESVNYIGTRARAYIRITTLQTFFYLKYL